MEADRNYTSTIPSPVETMPMESTQTRSRVMEEEDVEVFSGAGNSSRDSSGSLSITTNSTSTSPTDFRTFVIVKNTPTTASTTSTSHVVEEEAKGEEEQPPPQQDGIIKLRRKDVPNHSMSTPQQASSSFFQRLRTTRQLLGHRANDVWNAATPALSMAGQVVKTAATHAAVVASSTYETYEATTNSSSSSSVAAKISSSTSTNNPYDDNDKDPHPSSSSPSSTPPAIENEKDAEPILPVLAVPSTSERSYTNNSTTAGGSSGTVSSSFRGRYSLPSPPDKNATTSDHTPTKGTKTSNSLLQQALGIPLKQQQQHHHRPPQSSSITARRLQVRPTFTRSNSGGLLPPLSPFHHQSPMTSIGGIRSQTALILQSSAGPHMQSILSSLEPWEHVMLLGPGIMGVNLKDSYHGGVYVDHCVPNGNAEKSGVVHIGDILVRVGEVNVRKLSIQEVPGIIGKQPRPTVIVLSRKHLFPAEQDTNPLDRALATILDIHTRVKEERERSIASMPLTDTSSSTTAHSDAASAVESDYENDDLDSITPYREDHTVVVDRQSGRDDDSDEDQSIVSNSNESMTITSDSSYAFTATPRSSNTTSTARVPKAVQRSLAAYASRQHLQMSFYSAIKRAHGSMDPTFCQTMKEGLRALCADARCLPFFASHLTKHEALYEHDTAAANNNTANTTTTSTTSTNTARLMLLLETLAFYELWPLIPPQRRWHHASRVAQKFLLNDLPISHVRSDIPQKIVDDIEQTLTHHQDIPRNIFIPVQNHMEQVFCGMHFASFIMGENFARMRAYISGSPFYADVPLEVVINQRLLLDSDSTVSNTAAQNYMQYMMVHLVSNEANRGAGLAAALFLKRILSDSDTHYKRPLLQSYSQLWNVYLSPTGGILSAYQKSMSKDTADALMKAREDVWSTLSTNDHVLAENVVRESLHKLAEELIYEYAANVYPRFKMDRLHDLLFREVVDCQHKTQGLPLLAKGCISRLLRTAKFPRSISTHRPHRSAMVPTVMAKDEDSNSNVNAEFAVVFGSDPNSATAIRRYYAAQVGSITSRSKPLTEGSNVVTFPLPPRAQSVEDLPPALEDYAALNPGRFIKPPLENSQQIGARSEDGWDVYISNFTIPHASADYPTNCLHGVSLILYRSSPRDVHTDSGSEEPKPSQGSNSPMFRAIAVEGAERYLTFDIVHKVDQIFKEAPSPSRRQRSGPWSKQSFEGGYTIGISFVANHNVIPAMRQSLCDFLRGTSSCGEKKGIRVAALADLLGGFSSPEKNGNSIDLQLILRPYLESGSKEWIDRPLSDQAKSFEDHCILHLLKCLSPTAFGLAFLTVLLEQKVIFVSSRRTILLSAVTALSKLITPLEWPHLCVPTVPSHIAVNLIHYPVPFLIGLCSHDKDNQEISNVPKDVTVVDLDLGRVVLGEKYASSGDSVESSSELRLQVINLAEELGANLGSLISPDVWRCEDPLYVSGGDSKSVMTDIVNAGDSMRSFCHDFIAELTAGVDSCCVWIEEADSGMKQESMVLFDEDRFFHLKDLRSKNMETPLILSKDHGNAVGKFAIGLDEFDLILETFLRGQAMSAFISSRTKESMTYW